MSTTDSSLEEDKSENSGQDGVLETHPSLKFFTKSTIQRLTSYDLVLNINFSPLGARTYSKPISKCFGRSLEDSERLSVEGRLTGHKASVRFGFDEDTKQFCVDRRSRARDWPPAPASSDPVSSTLAHLRGGGKHWFRVEVPNGTYRVKIGVGDLSLPSKPNLFVQTDLESEPKLLIEASLSAGQIRAETFTIQVKSNFIQFTCGAKSDSLEDATRLVYLDLTSLSGPWDDMKNGLVPSRGRVTAYRLVGTDDSMAWPGLLFDETGSLTFRCEKAGPITILKDDYSMRFRKIVKEKKDVEKEKAEEEKEDVEENEAVSKDENNEISSKEEETSSNDDSITITSKDDSTTTTTVEATIVVSEKKDRIKISENESIYTFSEKEIGRYVTIQIRKLDDIEEKVKCTFIGRWEIEKSNGVWTPVPTNMSQDFERVFRGGAEEQVVRYQLSNRNYTADLRRRVQTNVSTGTERSLRRMLVVANEKGEAIKNTKRKVSRIGVDIQVRSDLPDKNNVALKTLEFASRVLCPDSLETLLPSRCESTLLEMLYKRTQTNNDTTNTVRMCLNAGLVSFFFLFFTFSNVIFKSHGLMEHTNNNNNNNNRYHNYTMTTTL